MKVQIFLKQLISFVKSNYKLVTKNRHLRRTLAFIGPQILIFNNDSVNQKILKNIK